MRIKISLEGQWWEIPAEEFTIDGSEDKFAVHMTAPKSIVSRQDKPLSASHIDTGFRIATGDTIDEAIENARQVWAGKTPEERAAAMKRAHELHAILATREA